MKNIIAFFIFILISISSSFAADDSLCQSWRGFARTIMEERQIGVSYSSMYAVAIKLDTKYGNDAQKTMVNMAYSYPRVYDPQAREELITSFSNRIYNICNGTTEVDYE